MTTGNRPTRLLDLGPIKLKTAVEVNRRKQTVRRRRFADDPHTVLHPLNNHRASTIRAAIPTQVAPSTSQIRA